MCKICLLPDEARYYIDERLKKRDMTYKEIMNNINLKYPHVNLNYMNIKWHRDKHLKITSAFDEKEIEKAVIDIPSIKGDELFSDKQRIASPELWFLLMREAWENYRKVKDSKQEAAKKNYFDIITKIKENMDKQRIAERDYITQLGIIKESHDKETMLQRLDSVKGWFIPEALKKAENQNEAITNMKDLRDMIQGIITQLEANKEPKAVAREVLDTIYGK